VAVVHEQAGLGRSDAHAHAFARQDEERVLVAGVHDPVGEPHPGRHLDGARDGNHLDPDAALAGRFESALAVAIDAGRAIDAVTASSESQREALWRLRESIPEAQRHEGAGLKHDISVEPSRLPQFIDEGRSLLARIAPGARLVAYGHLGDGNLHFNVSPAGGASDTTLAATGALISRAVHDLVAGHHGSISAEHGIGQLKVAELERYEDPVALQLMHSIKQALDPRGIMNPGKKLPVGISER